MKSVAKETYISFWDDPILAETKAIVTVHDEGCGPTLGIRGENDPQGDGAQRTDEFHIQDVEEIDLFCEKLKEILLQAQGEQCEVISQIEIDSEESLAVTRKRT